MNIKSFIDKWLDDLIDAQTMYNKNGAVPDTAPLGGDNRIGRLRRLGRRRNRLCRGKCMKHTAIYAYLKNAMI